jgi:hypothetical protein
MAHRARNAVRRSGTRAAICPSMSLRTDELKNRVEARKHELLAKFNELKADTRREAAETRDSLKKKLDEVESYLAKGWDDVNDSVKAKLSAWLDHEPRDPSDKPRA